jgi:spermidine/putrescine ABC transporter ATP-binding subunit
MNGTGANRTGSAPLSGRGASVTLSSLEKTYDRANAAAKAVDGVSLDIRSGEFLTLLGPSGSGKTTTLMMIAGFETPTAGDIAIDGTSVVAMPPYRRNIGMVFQNYALFPHLTVEENIGFPLKQRGVPKAERARLVAEALELVHLPGYGARYPRQLSGGQQQRVAVARAVVFKPRLLLMDEPLGALDKQLRENLQLEMRRLHADLGITFIYVTHDQEEALTMSDRIAVMNDGKVAQVGRPEDLYDRPDNRFVAGFIGESNFLPAVVRGMEDDVVIAECDGTLIRALCPGRPVSGEKVTLTTRPERLRFADSAWAATTPQNRMSVTVTEAVFAGERCRYMLQAGDGTSIVLKEPSSAAIRRRAVGERAEIAWSVADTILV